MKIFVIHLSDIHLISGKNSILEKIEKLYDVVKNSTKEFLEIFMVVSGDIAFSGKTEEYDIASALFNNLKKKIESYSGRIVHIITIPGNHDCDFDLGSKARQNNITSIQRLGDDVIDQAVIEQCSTVQSEYFNFREEMHDHDQVIYSSKVLTVYRYTIDQKTLLFRCYNTSYLSELREQPGKMHFPLSQIPEKINHCDADLVISLFHHPFNWFNPINKREFMTHIHKTCDFFMTGHEHAFSKSAIDDLEGNVVYHIEGSVLQESGDPFISEFNLLGFDLEQQSFKSKKLIWDTDRYHLSSNTSEWIPYKRGIAKLSAKYNLSQDRLRFLDEVGGKFSHPHKSNIILSDLFVFPKLRFFNTMDQNTETISLIYEDAESVVENLKPGTRLLLFGEENIGKTSLLKMMYKRLFKEGYVPVYIEGYLIKNTGLDDLRKVIERKFIEQYSNARLEDFQEEDLKKIFIMIDDIDKTTLKSRKAKAKLIKSLVDYYDNLILVGNELFAIEEIITDKEAKGDLYSSFKQYEILEFNHTKRSALVYKWYSLGREEMVEENDIWRKCDTAVKAINIAMGQRIVPNYPIFLLILLQSIETSTSHDLRISSYGNYYQLLILRSLTENIKEQSDLTMYQNYTSELANHFFESGTRVLSIEEFVSFHEKVTSFERFDLPFLTYEKALSTLKKVGILENLNETIEFKYLYTYYYFQAQFFLKNLRKEEVRRSISSLIKTLYKTDSANIIMFLIQFNGDEVILEELLKEAKSIFEDFEPCKLESDIDHLQNLVSELPKLYLKEVSVKQVRENENTSLDEIEESEIIEEETIEEDSEDTEIDIVAKVNVSFKLIEILGQILKNNHGAIDGSLKHSLLLETYMLGLRTMNSFFSVFNDNTEFALNHLKNIISKQTRDLNEEKLEKFSRNILFSLCSYLSFIFIKKVSDSVGSSKLADKYPKIYEQHNIVSVGLINFLIKLDNQSKFPDRDLSNIKTQVERHPMSFYVLKRVVINHLHRYSIDFKDKQRICTFLGIPLESQLKIEARKKKEAEES